MQKLAEISDKLIFVCYHPGAGGERLSVEISQLDVCEPLQSYFTDQFRTVITNDLSAKNFLVPVGPFDLLLERVKDLAINWPELMKLHVIPSHWDVEFLEPIFPHSRFIRIISPEDLGILHGNTDRKVMQGHCHSLAELRGYCLMYVTMSTFRDLLKEKKLNLSMTIGQIHGVLEPFVSEQTRRSVFSHDGANLYKKKIIKRNILNVSYQDSPTCMIEIESFLTRHDRTDHNSRR